MIAGHAHPQVIEAVQRATMRDGLRFGTPNPLEVTMAETHHALVPSLRDGAHGEFRHRGDDVGDPRSRAAPPGARAS